MSNKHTSTSTATSTATSGSNAQKMPDIEAIVRASIALHVDQLAAQHEAHTAEANRTAVALQTDVAELRGHADKLATAINALTNAMQALRSEAAQAQRSGEAAQAAAAQATKNAETLMAAVAEQTGVHLGQSERELKRLMATSVDAAASDAAAARVVAQASARSAYEMLSGWAFRWAHG